jgi:predicted transcriptional regulator
LNTNNRERTKDAKTIKINKTKSKILEHILRSPGVRYRQLLRFTGLSNSVLSYYLRNLEGSRHIIVNRDNNNRAIGYYPKNIKIKELQIIANLRSNTERRIVQFLLEQQQGQPTFNDIIKHIHKAPSTISWHIKKLKNAKIVISIRHDNRPSLYKLRNKQNVAKIFSKYICN